MNTLTGLFGEYAFIASGKLNIDLAALATAHGLETPITEVTPDQIAALVVMQIHSTTSDKTADPLCGITIERGFDAIVTRETESHYAYGYTTTIYTPNTATNLDPDDVI